MPTPRSTTLLHLPLQLLLLFLIGSAMPAFAQEKIHLTGSVGASVLQPLGTFDALGGVPTPGGLTFQSEGVSVQPWFWLGADAQFLEDQPQLRFGGRLGMHWYGMDYRADERLPIATENGGTYLATLDHQLGLTFTTVFLEPYVRYQITDWFAVEGGLPFQITMGSDHEQTMRFADPPNLPFLDGSTVITTGQGTIPGLSSLVPSLSLGAEAMIPLNRTRTIMLAPRVGATIPITAWETEAGLRTLALSGGLGVRYHLGEVEPDPNYDKQGRFLDTTTVRDTVAILSSRVEQDTVLLVNTLVEEYPNGDTVNVLITRRYQRLIPKPPAVLKAAVRLVFEMENGEVIDEARLDVTTVERTRTVPVLPVVVFNEGESSLPDRYRQLSPDVARRWKEQLALKQTMVHWQYHVLNIVGTRMQQDRRTSITLISYDDGTADGAILNAKRTAVLKEYLTSTFRIPPSRVRVDNRRGQASQQPWVFLADESRALLGPVTAIDTVIDLRLPRVRITPDVVTEAGLRSWQVIMTKDGDIVAARTGEGSVPATLIWDMNEDLVPVQSVKGPPVLVTLSVTDKEGTTEESEPGRVVVKDEGGAALDGINAKRTEVLRWIGADYFHTPDRELFGLTPEFDRIEVYPSASRREDFFVVNAPATVHPIGEMTWFRVGLHPAERPLFDHAEVYIKSERRP